MIVENNYNWPTNLYKMAFPHLGLNQKVKYGQPWLEITLQLYMYKVNTSLVLLRQ